MIVLFQGSFSPAFGAAILFSFEFCLHDRGTTRFISEDTSGGKNMTIDEKKDYLSQYRRLEEEIKCKMDELAQWKSFACRVTRTMSDTGGGSRGDDRIQKSYEKIEALRHWLEQSLWRAAHRSSQWRYSLSQSGWRGHQLQEAGRRNLQSA